MVIPRVPISAGLSTRGKWFSSSMVEVSRISSSLFATKTICLFWADWSQCRTVTESVQWCIDVNMKWCSLSICALTRDVEVTVAALVLVPRYLLWCNMSKTAETCDKTAPSIIERRNFFWGPEASRSKNFLCSRTSFVLEWLKFLGPRLVCLLQRLFAFSELNEAKVVTESVQWCIDVRWSDVLSGFVL